MVFDAPARRIVAVDAEGMDMTVNFDFTGIGEQYAVYLANSVLRDGQGVQNPKAAAAVTIRMRQAALNDVVLQGEETFGVGTVDGSIQIDGDLDSVAALLGPAKSLETDVDIIEP